MRSLVVVGASLAGLRAVEAARHCGFDGNITLIGAETHLPYDRPPLSKKFLDAGGSGTHLPFRDEAHMRDALNVTLRLGAPATALDTDRRVVSVGDDDIAFDALVLATGAHARSLPGAEHLRGVHALRSVDDAQAIRRALDAGARTVVIGAGFIGSEIASAAAKRGLNVTVVEALATPLVRAIGDLMGPAVAGLHERNGTRLLCGTSVDSLLGDDTVTAVRLADGTELPADLVVVGIGTVPATDWLKGSGLTLDNGIVCDENLCTGIAGIYAAGDVARWRNPLFDSLQRLEHWTSAAEQGGVAARNALDPANAKPYSTVPYFWSDWYGHRIQFVGITAADEVRVVDGDIDGYGRWVALYRKGDRLVGALTLDGQAVIMKYRGLILQRASWQDGLDLAEKRRAAAAATIAAVACA